MDWRERFNLELEAAARARVRGNEGRARVCARRAAGVAASEYLSRQGKSPRGESAMDVLQQLKADGSLDHDLVPIIDHLTQQVAQDFSLPEGVDLVKDARRLCQMLLPT